MLPYYCFIITFSNITRFCASCFVFITLCNCVRLIKTYLTVNFSPLGETNYGGGSNEEICACRQQPYYILLW